MIADNRNRFMFPGPRGTDANDAYKNSGPEAVRSVLSAAFAPPKPTTVADMFADLTLTAADVAAMSEAKVLIPDMIVQGHVSAWPAPANAGKTTIFVNYVCPLLVKTGVQVIYVNADAAPDALKEHFQHSVKHGYMVLAPDAKIGTGTAAVIDKLRLLAESGADLSNTAFILDTLKKFCDMLQKGSQKEFLGLMRRLSTKGATVILLSHTNKHADTSGKTIFEGTADLRNDIDELIYLDVFDNADKGVIEVTTRPDKVRAKINPISFTICKKTRQVKLLDEVVAIIPDDQRELLQSIAAAIRDGACKKEEIVEKVHRDYHVSRPKVREALERNAAGAKPFFNKETGFERNTKMFTLTERGEAL